MKRQSLLAVGGWVAAAVLAVVVGVTAVSLLGTGITSGAVRPVSQDDAEQQLASREPSAPPAAGGSAPASPSPSGGADGAAPSAGAPEAEVMQSDAGSVAARCVGDDAVLDWWAPTQGYTVDDVDSGPDEDVSVEFESQQDAPDMEMTVVCAAGTPRLVVSDDD
ncbi:septum formation initiator [Marinitenerispora sediminis]|nr:septum formation initiator [Marinitenerispora sediminis]RCV53873.1 septum formation initiator [Marinitenerispora sediminis]